VNPLGTWRRQGLERRIAEYEPIYGAPLAEVEAEQLARLNAAWSESLGRSPWARALQKRLSLPDVFASWAAFEAAVPVQRKPDLKAVVAAETGEVPGAAWRSTGGTTAEPLRFPVFQAEVDLIELDMWLGRARLGVRRDDRLFMIWGHSHMFGVGLGGAVARVRRQVLDRALGYTRWSAYRLSPEDLRHAGEALLRSGARYIIGYSTALDRFARANLDRAAQFGRLKLKAVIATAEGLPQVDSREAIEACFGAPLAMEYGTVETGPLAYQRSGGGAYDVFWAHNRLAFAEPPAADGSAELTVTTLYPRALPLMRYAIGDRAMAASARGGSITAIAAVVGRCNDAVEMADGQTIHSEAFTHAVRDIPGLRAYQVVARPAGAPPLIRCEADRIGPDAVGLIRSRLSKVHPALAAVEVETVMRIAPSVAGKHRMVVEEP
jgi:phenylacetate-coenzyme A ligase PaaK-like adenylate-forming protein